VGPIANGYLPRPITRLPDLSIAEKKNGSTVPGMDDKVAERLDAWWASLDAEAQSGYMDNQTLNSHQRPCKPSVI
jgi:hypothetical protein